tara:strand:- start:286 stop:906 length:621 start_codon:yes stop_codon:yes gene_type:complete
MALSTYDNLKTSVANYLGRTDLTDQIVDFVTLAETRLRRDLRLRTMLKGVTTSATSGDGTVALPSDFLEVRDIYVDTNPRGSLQYLTPSSFTTNGRATESGQPNYYTILASEFNFAPAPDSDYTFQLLYYAEPEFLSDTNSSNTFLANAPDALLYGSLVEAEPYLMNDNRIQVWASMLERSIDSLNRTAIQSQYSGVPLTMKLTEK